MLNNFRTVSKEISVNTTADKIWHVFINPVVSKQMGGEYISNWKVGNSIAWKGKDGQLHTNGTILEIQPERILKHTLYDLNDKGKLLSQITYEFIQSGKSTIIHAKEELNYDVSGEDFDDISSGWDYALDALRQIAESLE